MKGARLFVDRKEELQRHLEAEKEPKIRLKLVFLNAFSRFAPQLEETVPSVWHRHVYGLLVDTDVESGRLCRYPGRGQAHGVSAEAR